MTYARFLGLFVVLPILFLVVRYRRTLTLRGLAPLGILLGVVYVATTPWDNLAVKWGLWGFDPELTWGIKVGYLPLEEYLFFGLQTLLVGLWAGERLRRVLEAPEPEQQHRPAEAAEAGKPEQGAEEVAS
jgi:lycopene beta-cyclase